MVQSTQSTLPVSPAELVSQMTLAEKASLMSGLNDWQTKPIERLGIRSLWMSDGPHGVRREVAALDSMPATCFPTESALGATWDRELVARVAHAIGEEASAQGVDLILGPGINMKRTPLCGRNFEYFSEDPVQTGELAVAYINGLQESGVGACVKHFAANNQENERHTVSADVDERTFREIYAAAFERVIARAQPWAVMCSYNRLNGIHASQHPWLLTELLREEWGFPGLVVSDWWAVHDRVVALAAGLDVQMPGGEQAATDGQIVEAIGQQQIDPQALDRSAERVVAFHQLAADRPTPTFDEAMRASHHDLAREAAGAAAVLLKNDGTLPLATDPQTTIALIGRFAEEPRMQGGGSADVNPTGSSRLTEALAQRCDAAIVYEPGFALEQSDEGDGADPRALQLAAIRAAREADVVVLCLGLSSLAESEGYDRENLDLPADQVELAQSIAATGTPFVVVLTNGSAVLLGDWRESAAAIVQGWLSGQAGAEALADVLLGLTNPSGKLAETFPLRLQDTPSFANYPGERGHVRYGEGGLIGYRWYDALDLPVRYPFGYGLSYTDFEFGDLQVDVVDPQRGQVEVSCTVTNVGTRPGAEVAQLYVGDDHAVVRRAPQELKAFAKIPLEPGETATCRFSLCSRDFAYYDIHSDTWRHQAGTFTLAVGASSRDIRLQQSIELADDPQVAALVPDDQLRDIIRRSSVVERE